MEFLVDECAGPSLVSWLRRHGHDVVSVYEVARGADDAMVLAQAVAERRILVTADKDFGMRVFKERKPHCGVVLLRLHDERAPNKLLVMERVLEQCSDRLADNFLVATEKAIRISGGP